MAKQSKCNNKDLEDLFEERKLDVSAVAKVLGCSMATVYRLMHNNELEYIRTGQRKGYKILASSLQKFIERRISKL